MHLQRSKLKVVPWVSWLLCSIPCLSTVPAILSRRCLSCQDSGCGPGPQSECVGAWKHCWGGSHPTKCSQKEQVLPWAHSDTAITLTPIPPEQQLCNCLETSVSSQAFQIHLSPCTTVNSPLVSLGNIPFYGAETTLLLWAENSNKHIALISIMSFPIKRKWLLGQLSFLWIM